MAKNEKNKIAGSSKKILIPLLIILLVVNVVGMIFINPFGWGDSPPKHNDTNVHLLGEGTPDSYVWVEYSTDEYEFSYNPYMRDIVIVKEIEGSNGCDLEFYARLSGGEALLFKMYYNSNKGSFTHEAKDSAGNSVTFGFEMKDLPEGLGESDEYTFFTAQ